MHRLAMFLTLCAVGLASRIAVADDVKTPQKRTVEQIQGDMQKVSGELQGVITGPDSWVNPEKRKEAGPKAIPVLKRMLPLFEEVAAVQPDAKDDMAMAQVEVLTLLCVFGDADSTATLASLSKGKGTQAVAAQGALQLGAYWANPKDEAAQLKVLDEVQKIAKANPAEDIIVSTLMKMSQMGAASPAVRDKAESIITNDLTGQGAKQVAMQIKGERKMRESVGKPVELAGTKIDGTAFSTKDWKGKVIFVDFWATWCGPCLAELPRVKKAYLNYHAKGLEILGVSCDRDAEALKGFLEQNKDMPWPQLFDAKENPKIQWSPLAKEWGINGIPTMFLIDKKGILRSVTAREDFEKQIPELLAEKAE